MGRGRTPGSQKRIWKTPKNCSGNFGNPVGAGQEDEIVFAATRGLPCWLSFLWEAATGGLPECQCSDRWAAEDITCFSPRGVFPPRWLCLFLLFCIWVYGAGLLTVCVHAAGLFPRGN